MTGVLKWLGSWKELKYGPNIYRGACCSWQEHHMTNFDPNWCVMVLKWLGSWKEATEYTFCNNSTCIKDIGLKFWYNMGTYSGISDINFSWLSPLLWKLACFLCVLGGSWKETMITLFVITLLILGVQDWHFDTIWAPIVETFAMNFSALLALLWELLSFLCVSENTPNLLINGHNGLAGVQSVEKF